MVEISVIIPVYNAERTIIRCVESLLGGSYKNIEVILIDDCSKDCSFSKCQMLAQKYKNIKVIRNNQNRGVSYSRNVGLLKATGKYIMFVDSDDWVDEQYLDTFEHLQEEGESLFIICGYFNHDEKQSGRTDKFVWSQDKEIEKADIKIVKELYEKRLLQQLWNKIFSANLIRKHKIIFDESISIGEDFRFVLEYIKKCNIKEICIINKPLYHYMRDQKGSLMYRVGYEGIEEPLKNLKTLYEILQIPKDELEKILKKERKKQLELYAYLIFHNYGMKISEKKRLILDLDKQEGKTLYAKNRIIYLKEHIWIILDKICKIGKRDGKSKD